MPPPLPLQIQQALAAADAHLRGGRAREAAAVAAQAAEAAPRLPQPQQVLASALLALGDRPGAEQALRRAAGLDKRDPRVHVVLADLLAEDERFEEAEKAYRAALAADRRFVPAALGLAHLLMWLKRPAEAAQALLPLAVLPNASVQALEMYVRALLAAGRHEDALPFARRAAAAGAPQGEVGAAQIALDLGRLEEAAAGFRAELAREPGNELARRGLARALFGGPTGMAGALEAVDEGLAWRWTPGLAAFKASLLTQDGRPAEAHAVMEEVLARVPAHPDLLGAAANAANAAGQPERAISHAERALALAPGRDDLSMVLVRALLGAGEARRAYERLEPMLAAAPLDQARIAFTAVARRLMGDERYGRVYDYARFVRPSTIEPPRGWSSLPGFMRDLTGRLHEIHDAQAATLDQSVRGGTQTNVNLVHTRDPILRALFSALEGPIADYVAALGCSDDPLREPLAARNRGGFAIGGAWSVRLRPGVGRHVNHIHSEGWLSSAFYVELPSVVGQGSGQEGWIQFGEPGMPTRPALGAEHAVRPEAGRLVLFPSYMWHGTLPFGGDERRMTFAFDVVPKDR